MSPVDSRSRMISFRLSVEEYEKVLELCSTSRIHSLSQMARVAINSLLKQPPPVTIESTLEARVSDLEAKVHILSTELKRSPASTSSR